MINPFEYVTVLISIVLGLGITQILTGIADLVHQSKRVKVYWPHLLWVIVILVLHVQDWWVTFDLRNFAPWRLPTFLFVMMYPVVLFILARLLFPFGIQEGVVDLKEFYFENYRKIFVFGATLPILAILNDLFVRGTEVAPRLPLGPELTKLILPIFLISMCIRKKESPEWVHKLIALAFLGILVTSIIIEWNVWLIVN
jgi:hypothetical protein